MYDQEAFQQWEGMPGDTAFSLIERHADDWQEAGAMMEAWLRANTATADASIPEFLGRLSYDQLCNCRERAAKLIAEKDEEARVTVWAIESPHENFAYRATYPEAVAYLSKRAAELDHEQHESDKQIGIRRLRIRASDVAEYLM